MKRIGVSACFFHADPNRAIFKGKTLLYLEDQLAHWLMSGGVIPYMLPLPAGEVTAAALIADLDGLVLQGGSDVCPRTYGEEPMKPEWSGDAIRDAYEISLIQECLRVGKPVLGICRGLQILNVALGGTLLQDIQTQKPEAQVHRDWEVYDRLLHDVEFAPDSHLRKLYGRQGGRIVSVHHQAIKDLGRDLRIEARSVSDGIIEAICYTGNTYAMAVQWHPEFQEPNDAAMLPTEPLLREFLAATA